MKIVLNKCFGGYGLSKLAYKELGLEWDGFGYAYDDAEERTNKKLIKCIEKIGEKAASGELAYLRIIEIPDGIEFEIDNYDGVETVIEKGHSW
jgi:hypothetical protein